LVDKHGRDWGKSQIAKLPKMAMDAAAHEPPPQPRLSEQDRAAVEHDNALRKLCLDVEQALEKLHVDPRIAGSIIEVLNRHKGESKPVWRGDAVRHRARDEEPERDLDLLKHFLKGRGLDDDELTEVVKIIERADAEEAEAKDRLPANAMHSKNRDDAKTLERFPEAQRIGTAVPGRSQFDGARDGRSARERRIAADAASSDAGARLAKKFPGIERIKVGLFDR
jgi:hypothetical protein